MLYAFVKVLSTNPLSLSHVADIQLALTVSVRLGLGLVPADVLLYIPGACSSSSLCSMVSSLAEARQSREGAVGALVA